MLKYGHKYFFFLGSFLVFSVCFYDNYLFVLVSAFRSANVFPYALRFAFDLIEKRFLVFVQQNSFDQGRALFFF